MSDDLGTKVDEQIIGINFLSDWLINELDSIHKLECSSGTRLALQTVAMLESLYRQGLTYEKIKALLISGK